MCESLKLDEYLEFNLRRDIFLKEVAIASEEMLIVLKKMISEKELTPYQLVKLHKIIAMLEG